MQRAGPEAERVLVFGAGLAAGLGTGDHERSLAGCLATAIHERDGRGVDLDVVAARVASVRALRRASHRLPERGFDVIVFAPCPLEDLLHGGCAVERDGAALLASLLAATAAGGRLVLLGFPRPRTFSPLDLAVAERADHGNRALRALAESDDRLLFLPAPPFASARSADPHDADYYAAIGLDIAEALAA